MKNIETPDKMHLEKLIHKLRDGNFVIPDFQREFEWSPADVRELLKSIFEDYYIGTLLLWRASKDNQQLLSCENIYSFNGKPDPQHIVLDGQQRLSALYYAFFAPETHFPNRKNRCLFTVKLEELLNENFDEALEYEWLTKKVKKLLSKEEDQFEKKILPLSILGQRSKALYKWLEGYENYWSERVGEKKALKEKDKIEKFFDELLASYDVSYIELDRDIEVSKVCDIFTKINSTGEPLSIFDLLNALLRPKDIYLKDMWRKISEDFQFFGGKNTRVQLLQTMSILEQGYCAPKYLYYLIPNSRKTIKVEDGSKRTLNLISSKEEFIGKWNFVVEKVKQTIKVISNHRDFGAVQSKFIPYPTMLPILTAINIEKEKDNYVDRKDIENKIKKWYWSSIFTKNYSSAAESQMTRDFYEMKKWFENGNNRPRVVNQFENEIDNLDLKIENTQGSAIYKAIFNILILKGAKDWDTFALPEYSVLEDHHIVPYSWGKKNIGRDINSVLNRTPISDETNKKIIRDQLPNVYLKKMFDSAGNKGDMYSLLESHLISRKAIEILLRGNFSKDDYYEFIEERRNTIIKEVKEILGIQESKKSELITPDSPFSNKIQIEQTIKQCDSYLYWADKYFSLQGLKLLSQFLNKDKVKEIKILTSIEKVDENFRSLFKDFKSEMRNKGVSCELRVITDRNLKSQIHDRWIISKYKSFNIPSPDTIARGQYSEIKETENILPFEKWWGESSDIITEWNKIKEIKNGE